MRRSAVAFGLVSGRPMGGGVPVILRCIRADRNRRPDIRCCGTDPSIFLVKGCRAVDPGGFGHRLVGKVRRCIGRGAEILAAVSRHLDSKCRNRRQRKTDDDKRNLQPSLHDFSPHSRCPAHRNHRRHHGRLLTAISGNLRWPTTGPRRRSEPQPGGRMPIQDAAEYWPPSRGRHLGRAEAGYQTMSMRETSSEAHRC